MKLLIAALTALGLIGTGAHQAGFFDIEAEPTSVNCAHDCYYSSKYILNLSRLFCWS
jgi:hypothetical protein